MHATIIPAKRLRARGDTDPPGLVELAGQSANRDDDAQVRIIAARFIDLILIHPWIQVAHRYVERTVSRDDFSRADAGLATSGRRFHGTPRQMAEEIRNGGGDKGWSGADPGDRQGESLAVSRRCLQLRRRPHRVTLKKGAGGRRGRIHGDSLGQRRLAGHQHGTRTCRDQGEPGRAKQSGRERRRGNLFIGTLLWWCGGNVSGVSA